MTKQKSILINILIFSILFAPNIASARYFDPNDILTDAELFDSSALSITAIQKFLDSKNSVLKSTTATVNGVEKLVSEMIYDIGKTYGVSQKFLLAKLQHEQGLIEKSTATQTALDWATGYSCFGGRCNEKYRGIYAQLEAAADTQKIYAEKSASSGYFGYQVGKTTTTSDGYSVTPANQATTNLYIYTPYQGSLTGIGGNFFFSRVWNKYFTQRSYPDGALLYDSSTGEYWRIEKNKKRKFAQSSIYLADHKQEDAIPVTSSLLSYYETSSPITIANNTLVSTSASATMYLISDGKKHRVVGESALASLGMRLATTDPVTPAIISESELTDLSEGEPITETSIYPKGALLKSENNAIYYVKHGIKYILLDEAVWQENFARKEPTYVLQATLNSYKDGGPVALCEGALVRSEDGKFYLVSNGKRKRIATADLVKKLFNLSSIDSIPTASNALLELTSEGDSIDYIDDTVVDPANYVPYAYRIQSNTATVKNNSYFALFDILDAPKSIVSGASATITVRFRNRGTTPWPAGKTYLKIIDEDHETSSFIKENRIPLGEDVTYNMLASFKATITAPTDAKKIKEWFILEYTDENGNIYEMAGGMVSQYINSTTDVSGQIISHNIPVAIKNTYAPKQVEVKIKNTSTKEVWTSRRSALSLVGADGKDSVFYDPNDWIDKKMVGVPFNDSYISPGETGIIRFTLDPQGVRTGTYRLIFSMELRDSGKKVYLNGAENWELLIRVDK